MPINNPHPSSPYSQNAQYFSSSSSVSSSSASSLPSLNVSSSKILSFLKKRNKQHLVVYGIAILLVLLPWGSKLLTIRKLRKLEQSIMAQQEERLKLKAELQMTQSMWRKHTIETVSIEKENEALLKKLKELGDDNVDMDDKQYMQANEREELYLQRIKLLEKTIQMSSNRHLKETYGKGPYLIRVKLSENVNGLGDTLVIETLRQDIMPHAIELFMKQVESNLWNGASLYHEMGNNGSSSSTTIKENDAIHALLLDSKTHHWKEESDSAIAQQQLVFPEYDPEYPLQKYSVAFKGTPGGPEFFIHMGEETSTEILSNNNKSNNNNQNSDLHHDICFGKVISGTKILDFIRQDSSPSHATKGLLVPATTVGIESMVLMKRRQK